jgi:hypothetical protein
MKIVLIPCLILYTDECELFLIAELKFINETIYWHGTAGRISNCLNRFLHEVLFCAPAIILTIFFCKVKIFPTVKTITPKSYSISYNRMKECILN